MAIYQLARTGHDIINGLVTVSQGAAPPAYYDPLDRDQHLALGDSLAQWKRLDAAYKVHGGPGGSGAWEH